MLSLTAIWKILNIFVPSKDNLSSITLGALSRISWLSRKPFCQIYQWSNTYFQLPISNYKLPIAIFHLPNTKWPKIISISSQFSYEFAYQTTSLSTIKPINLSSSFATFKPFGLFDIHFDPLLSENENNHIFWALKNQFISWYEKMRKLGELKTVL